MILRLFALLFFPLTLLAEYPAPATECAAFMVFDATSGKVLLEKNSRERRPVASTQKLLTALLVVEAGDLDQIVTITSADTKPEPTKLYLQPGEKYTRRKLLQAMLIRSPNDAAAALARDHSGSVEAFAEAMNERMRSLQGTDSQFKNPHGLPEAEQFSTARDMAIVARAVYFNATLREMMLVENMAFKRTNGQTINLRNTNRVMRTLRFCNGMKTGYTRASGHCLISSGTWNGRHIIAVVLGSNKARVWDESARLLAYGLQIEPAKLPNFRRDAPSSGAN